MRLLTMGSFLLIVAHAASGDAATAQQPKPGPEVQRLGYYLGSWRGEGETKGGPFGPAGKLSSARRPASGSREDSNSCVEARRQARRESELF